MPVAASSEIGWPCAFPHGHNHPIRHLPLLLAAVERGDDAAAFELLEEVTAGELAGEDAVTLLAAAAYAGRDEVVDWLVQSDVDVTRPWAGGVDPVTWAAEHGMYWILQALLSRSRDPLSADGPHRRALRAAQDAIGSRSDVTADQRPAHRAVLTDLEAVLGIRRSPDELLARALAHGDPWHDDWSASLFQLGVRADQETFDWARKAAEDTSSLGRRRFGLDTVNVLGFGLDVDKDDEPPFTREAAEFLRPLLDTEQDPHALAAFTGYCHREEVPAILIHADHIAPNVRRSVATHLFVNPALGAAEQQEVLAALVRLAADPAPRSGRPCFTNSPCPPSTPPSCAPSWRRT
ncbi:ankyrin repeat domain-containing protein [Kitasatospora purpeofusca]|uniref:ankyrin repeat domain-containing protein n=1 Tax=Kitasatospora purpeofusca TaxID=67352 RepID=UPI003698C442